MTFLQIVGDNTSVYILLLCFSFFLPQWALAQGTSDFWKDQYIKAKEISESQPLVACKKFQSLGKSLKFPLRKLAYLRSLEICKNVEVPLWNDIHNYVAEPWLEEILAKIRFDFILSQNLHHEAFLFWEQNKKTLDLSVESQIDLFKKALLQASKVEDKKNIQMHLEKVAPRFIQAPNIGRWHSVANDFKSDRQFKKSIEYFNKIINSSETSMKSKWKAFKGIRKVYKLEKWKKNKKYVESSKKWAAFLDKKFKTNKKWVQLHHSAQVEYIRTLWTERDRKQALPILQKAKSAFSGIYSLQTLLWLEAKMAEEQSQYTNTVDLLQKALKEPSLGPNLVEKIRWNLAWNLRRIGKFDQASKQLGKLQSLRSLSPHTLTKYIFWEAKSRLENNEGKERAHKLLKRIIDVDPYGFYSSLAHRELKIPFAKVVDKSFTENDFLKLFKNSEDFQKFNWYAAVGESDIAHRFLVKRLNSKKGWPPESWAKYLKLKQRSGNYLGFFNTFHSLKPSLKKTISKMTPSLLFPTPYLDDVQKSSQEHGVETALIYSIMKQESGFNPRARSFADAFGLMQLIPQVAAKTAEGFPQYRKVQDLYIPKINIYLGTKTLKNLFLSYKNQFVLSVASYNASSVAVRGWVKSRFKEDPLEFIEDIPYSETKGYVKLVLRNYISYRRFLQDKGLEKFPEETLHGLENFK